MSRGGQEGPGTGVPGGRELSSKLEPLSQLRTPGRARLLGMDVEIAPTADAAGLYSLAGKRARVRLCVRVPGAPARNRAAGGEGAELHKLRC